jgi:hypothetical protein
MRELLGKDGGEPGRKNKKMWPIALESMLGVLGLKILLIEDEAATARTLALRIPVDRANQRFGNVCRSSATLLPPPSQPASPPCSRSFPPNGQPGREVRLILLSKFLTGSLNFRCLRDPNLKI